MTTIQDKLDVEKWKRTLNDLGELAFKTYFINDPIDWKGLSLEIRSKWTLVAMALSEKLCSHDDKTVTSAGNVWCNKCGWQIPKKEF